MTIKREDLAAAAAVGLLHSRQIDPLLVYLLQRDVRGMREAMLVQRRPAPFGRLNMWLSYAAGALALLTGTLFAVLFAVRPMQLEIGVLAFLTVLYMLGALGLTAWIRMHGVCARARMITAVMMASVPLAVVALHHVSS